MGDYVITIESINKLTPDVLRIVTNKPSGFEFDSGQAAKIAINKNEWKKEKRPFSFTNLPTSNSLEFTIKAYPENESMTNELLQLKEYDELLLQEAFGSIEYKGEGVFIAGGAGVTPFISIFRELNAKNEIGDNLLIFANKTREDILLEQEFSALLGSNYINILSEENVEGYFYGLITEGFLKEHITNFKQYFYLCGPPPMVASVEDHLVHLGAHKDYIIKEQF